MGPLVARLRLPLTPSRLQPRAALPSAASSSPLFHPQAQNAELHRLRWEARSRDEEIRELQEALSDSKLYLYDERENALRLAAENDSLKAQEIEDRKRIAHLLALTEPMTQEVRRERGEPRTRFSPTPPSLPPPSLVPPPPACSQFTFFRDSRPAGSSAAASAPPHSSRQAPAVGRNGFGVPPPPPGATATASVRTAEGGRALRTVVLPGGPYDRSDSLSMTVESLTRQLSEVRTLADDRASAYARDRDALRDQHARKANADAATIRQLEQQLEANQTKLTNLTRGEWGVLGGTGTNGTERHNTPLTSLPSPPPPLSPFPPQTTSSSATRSRPTSATSASSSRSPRRPRGRPSAPSPPRPRRRRWRSAPSAPASRAPSAASTRSSRRRPRGRTTPSAPCGHGRGRRRPRTPRS